MELIQFNKNGGPVTIHISIEGISSWSYIYVSDFTFRNNTAAGKPANHTLGLPVNLDEDINSWDVRLGNIGNEEATATVAIVWRQNGNELNRWTRDVKVPASSATKTSDDALLVVTP